MKRRCAKCRSANTDIYFGVQGAPHVRCLDCGHKKRTGIDRDLIHDMIREYVAANGGGGLPAAPKLSGDPLPLGKYAKAAAPEAMDLDAVRKLIVEELKKTPPTVRSDKLTVVHAKGEEITVDHAHAALKESLRRIAAGFPNVLLVGPAGSGKSTLAAQMATCLKRDFGFLSLSGGTTEGQLLGRLSSTGEYLPSLFVQLYEKGGVFLLDEVDAADPNVLLVLNSALANGHLAVPARVKKPTAVRHKHFVLVCAANTWGTGADWQYVGRNQLDAAFLSRFAGAVLEVQYDEKLERALTVDDWYTEFIRVRERAVATKLRRILGTRELLAGQRLLKAGYERPEVWSALTQGWTMDERSKAGVPC